MILLALVILIFALPEKETKTESEKNSLARSVFIRLEDAMVRLWCPALSFADEPAGLGIWEIAAAQFPQLSFMAKQKNIVLLSESGSTYEEIIRAEGQDEYSDEMGADQMRTPESSDGRILADEEMQKLLRQENEAIQNQEKDAQVGAGKDSEADKALESGLKEIPEIASDIAKKETYQWNYYEKFDALVKEFYAVDASTVVDESQLNLEDLLGKDLSIEKRTDDSPQILIYHTQSQEKFADSVQGDRTTTIEGVGEVLTRILEDQYGYNVLHHLGQYDVENRDYAYNNSLPAIEALLEENPTIEVVIDLHRDQMAEQTRLVTEIDGRPTAMFMFFNGLSRTRKHGDIDYLPNENIADNLAFSFQMQVLCNEYYPGLTRRIYLKGYRYNMHLKARYLLIEMGAQNNTYEECYNACIPLAKILDMELSGADFGY